MTLRGARLSAADTLGLYELLQSCSDTFNPVERRFIRQVVLRASPEEFVPASGRLEDLQLNGYPFPLLARLYATFYAGLQHSSLLDDPIVQFVRPKTESQLRDFVTNLVAFSKLNTGLRPRTGQRMLPDLIQTAVGVEAATSRVILEVTRSRRTTTTVVEEMETMRTEAPLVGRSGALESHTAHSVEELLRVPVATLEDGASKTISWTGKGGVFAVWAAMGVPEALWEKLRHRYKNDKHRPKRRSHRAVADVRHDEDDAVMMFDDDGGDGLGATVVCFAESPQLTGPLSKRRRVAPNRGDELEEEEDDAAGLVHEAAVLSTPSPSAIEASAPTPAAAPVPPLAPIPPVACEHAPQIPAVIGTGWSPALWEEYNAVELSVPPGRTPFSPVEKALLEHILVCERYKSKRGTGTNWGYVEKRWGSLGRALFVGNQEPAPSVFKRSSVQLKQRKKDADRAAAK